MKDGCGFLAMDNSSKGIGQHSHSQDGEYQRNPKQSILDLCKSGLSYLPTLTGNGKEWQTTLDIFTEDKEG